ncbi:MAG TPA: cyclase family protein [Myxococcota bacterium]|nr:cyclase family protein [Myxococcota bacterium]
MPGRLVDLSHAVEHGLRTYPGLPEPAISTYLSHDASRERYAPGTEFHIGRIEMVANTGTYLDSPFHRYRDGADLSGLPLESLADLRGRVVDGPASGRRVTASELPDTDLAGQAVLFRTGWSRHWGTPRYFEPHPFLDGEVAKRLAAARVALVGIDSLNIDDTQGGERPVHSALLRAGIPIVEHLTGLDALPTSGFRLFAVPVKVRGMGTIPVRAFARLD